MYVCMPLALDLSNSWIDMVLLYVTYFLQALGWEGLLGGRLSPASLAKKDTPLKIFIQKIKLKVYGQLTHPLPP